MSGTRYTFAFVNQKGGVGKTTTAVNLGAFLAWQGRRVLLVDLDPQGNASASVGIDRAALSASVYDVFIGSVALDEILTPSVMDRLTVVPSTPILASAEVELANVDEREFILRNALGGPGRTIPRQRSGQAPDPSTALGTGSGRLADSRWQMTDRELLIAGTESSDTLQPAQTFSITGATPSAISNTPSAIRDRFDHILIDCPPSLGILTVNALTAADYVVVPVQCEYLALEGLAQLMQTIALVRENLNPDLKLFGLVMTMFDPRGRLATQVIQEVRTHFPNEVFETLIPRNVRVAEAPSFGQPLVQYDIHSRGAEAYEKLTNEFLMREARIADGRARMADGESYVAGRESQVGSTELSSAISESPAAISDTPLAIGDPPYEMDDMQPEFL